MGFSAYADLLTSKSPLLPFSLGIVVEWAFYFYPVIFILVTQTGMSLIPV